MTIICLPVVYLEQSGKRYYSGALSFFLELKLRQGEMQFLRQQSARWAVGKPSIDQSQGNSANDNKLPREDEVKSNGESEHPKTENNNDEDGHAPQSLPVTSMSTFLASSILRISRDVSQQAQQQAVAAAAAYMTHQQNRVFEQQDPVLQRTLRLIQQEHEKIKSQRQTNRAGCQEYQREESEIKAQRQAKERDLWLKQQNNKLNPLGLNEYRVPFVPESDASANMLEDDASTTSLVSEKEQVKVITAQAKLCRAQHNEWMTDRQMEMIRTFQQEMIDYMFNGMMPTLKNEALQVEQKGKEDVEKFRSYKHEVERLYQKIITLQEQIMQEYRSKLTPEELDAIRKDLEPGKVAEASEAHVEEDAEHLSDDSDEDKNDSEAETEEENEEYPESADLPPKESPSLGASSSRENQALLASSLTHEKTPHEFQISKDAIDDVSDVHSVSTSINTPMGTTKPSCINTAEDNITLSGKQERIAEPARQLEAHEENVNTSKSTRSAPRKTSSRSDLLERARIARNHNASAMNNSPVRPSVSRHSSGSALDKAPVTPSKRVTARRNLASRQQNGSSINHNDKSPAVTAPTSSGLSEERRAQIRNNLRAGNNAARINGLK
jgi:hypothetical protein